MQDEVAHLVIPDRSQERRAQTQAPRADTDVGWAATDVGGETADLHEWSTNVVGVEVDAGSPHGDHIISWGEGRAVPSQWLTFHKIDGIL